MKRFIIVEFYTNGYTWAHGDIAPNIQKRTQNSQEIAGKLDILHLAKCTEVFMCCAEILTLGHTFILEELFLLFGLFWVIGL